MSDAIWILIGMNAIVGLVSWIRCFRNCRGQPSTFVLVFSVFYWLTVGPVINCALWLIGRKLVDLEQPAGRI
jgi:hypothetical protein